MLRFSWNLACFMSYNRWCFENNMCFASGKRSRLEGIGKSNVYTFSIILPWSKSGYFETHATFISWWKQRKGSVLSDSVRSNFTWTKMRCNFVVILLNLYHPVEHENSFLYLSVLVEQASQSGPAGPQDGVLSVASSFGARVHPCEVCVLVLL